MSTKQCKNCGKRISEKEDICPHCGEPVQSEKLSMSMLKSKKTDEKKPNKNLTTCKACGEQISKNAKKCPHCGEPLPKKKKTSLWAWFVLLLFISWFLRESGLVGTKEKATHTNKSALTQEVCVEFVFLHPKEWWDQELGEDSSGYRIKIWEKSNKHGKGKVVGYASPGDKLKLLSKGKSSSFVSSQKSVVVGWISNSQVGHTEKLTHESYTPCK